MNTKCINVSQVKEKAMLAKEMSDFQNVKCKAQLY